MKRYEAQGVYCIPGALPVIGHGHLVAEILKNEIEEGEVNAIRNPVVNYLKKAR